MAGIPLSLICLILMAATCRSKDPDFPNISKLTENGFVTKVEITGRPENYTALVEEFYDVAKKVTKVNILKGGHRQTIVLHSKFNQVANIENNVCEVRPAQDTDAILNPMFQQWLYSASEDSEVYYGPTSILRRAYDDPPKYISTSTVRGMQCHEFMAKDPDNDKVSVSYFFTADWTTPVNISKSILLPVRIRFSGEGIPMEGSPNEDFIQYVDYVYFVPALRNPRLYELPTGIGCKGLKSDLTNMPKITEKFTMQGELIEAKDSSADTSVKTFRIWYDYPSKFARLDLFTKESSVSKVLDYNTGVMYVTRDNNECEALSISESNFDKITGDLRLVMKDPDTTLGINGEYYYLGKKFSRGIYCDVWETVVENQTIEEDVLDRMVYTYYFSSHWWEINVEGEIEEQVPIRLEINTYQNRGEESLVQTVFNFFRFSKHPMMSIGPFRIEDCASGAPGKSYIAIDMETNMDDATRAEKHATEFQEYAEQAILKLAGISPIRLPFVRVDYLPTDISIMALILERAPALAQFVKTFDDTPKKKEINKGTFKTEELCAEECIKSEVCTGFHYCEGKGNCYISLLALDSDWGDPVENVENCNLYERHIAASEMKDVLLKEALDNLNASVADKTFFIEIMDKAGNETDVIKFQASNFESGVSPVIAGGHDKDMFIKVSERNKLKKVQTTRIGGGTVFSAGECYRKCQSEENIACSSFSFCIHDNECLLSSLLILPDTIPKDEVESNPMCTLYSIAYLQMFERYSGQIRLTPGKDAVSAGSAEECAKLCRGKKKPMCRGFDFCSKTCIMHDKHVLDIPDNKDLVKVGEECSHYALRFSADYEEVGRFVIVDPNSITANGDSVETCSKACSEYTQFDCSSFDFCASTVDEKSKCVLNIVNITQDGVKTEDSNKCKHYLKKDVIADYVKPKPEKYVKRTKSTPDTSGYTPGGLAGVIIGVMIFGIVVGIIGFLTYSYFRKSGSMNERSVRFVKQENA